MKADVIFVSVERNSGDLSSLELSPVPHVCYSHMKENYFLKKYTSKTFLDVNIKK